MKKLIAAFTFLALSSVTAVADELNKEDCINHVSDMIETKSIPYYLLPSPRACLFGENDMSEISLIRYMAEIRGSSEAGMWNYLWLMRENNANLKLEGN